MQSSFLPGWGTMENAIIAHEVLHHMSVSSARHGMLAFKIDIEKAYDDVSWKFLKETMILFGLPPILIDLIMQCVSSSSISLLWNGARLPPYKPGRGLRQGDSISPYLFVMCMERLSVHIQHLVDNEVWKLVRVSVGGPPIS